MIIEVTFIKKGGSDLLFTNQNKYLMLHTLINRLNSEHVHAQQYLSSIYFKVEFGQKLTQIENSLIP